MSGRFETARKVKAPKPPREKKPRKKLQMPGWKTLLLLILNITLAALSVLCAARPDGPCYLSPFAGPTREAD